MSFKFFPFRMTLNLLLLTLPHLLNLPLAISHLFFHFQYTPSYTGCIQVCTFIQYSTVHMRSEQVVNKLVIYSELYCQTQFGFVFWDTAVCYYFAQCRRNVKELNVKCKNLCIKNGHLTTRKFKVRSPCRVFLVFGWVSSG